MNGLGEIIKKYRIKKGLTQKELSELSHISYSYLTKIETDKKSPSPEVLVTLLILLDIPGNEVEEFFDDEILETFKRRIMENFHLSQYNRCLPEEDNDPFIKLLTNLNISIENLSEDELLDLKTSSISFIKFQYMQIISNRTK